MRITSVINFRDVAGDGMPVAGGRRMATGVVYRSSAPTAMTAADRRKLARAGLSEILDLRTPPVARSHPDPKIAGATYHLINLYAVTIVPKVDLTSVDSAKAYMRSINVGFVANAAERGRTAATLKLIAAASGPVLVHCTEGKDRTGWISAVLQLTAGASHAEVLANYLASNRYRAARVNGLLADAKRSGGDKSERIMSAVLKVDATYLDAGLDELTRRYGSIDGYLTKGLGLSAKDLQELRARLVG